MSGRLTKNFTKMRKRLSKTSKQSERNSVQGGTIERQKTEIQKSDIKIIKKSEYPVEQNPFGEDDDFSDEDNLPQPSQTSPSNITIASNSINPAVPLNKNSTSSPLSKSSSSIKTTTKTTLITTTTTTQTRTDLNHNNNNLNLNLNKSKAESETMDRTSVSNPHSNNSRESNPFGEYEDEDEATNKHGLPNGNNNNNNTNGNINDDSDDEAQKTSYLNIKVKALYDYHSVEDDELSFKAGDEFIKLATEDERGWCLGKIGGKVGLYPATYASEV